MELPPDIEDILLKDFTNQELTPDESKILNAWLQESTKNEKIYVQMKLAFLQPEAEDLQKLKTTIWADIQGQRKIKIQTSSQGQSLYYLWARVAAILIFCVSIAILFYQYTNDGNEVALTSAEIKMTGKVSDPGQKLFTTLPDGSSVKLNGDSKILYAEEFAGDYREVILYGEAFFEVIRDENKPFIIRTKDIEVKVLGTSFNIESYPGEASSMVAVASGKVAVKGLNQQMLTLDIGEKVAYHSDSESLTKENFDWEEEYGWKDNVLVFNKASLTEIFNRLNKWYGVEFIQRDDIPEKKFSGRYVNPTLNAVLEGLSYVYNFEYSIELNQVVLKNKTKENHEH
ncbi:MAG: FecR family protein [Cyclobacteriaceae bacterium]